jgi:hypothetical protein
LQQLLLVGTCTYMVALSSANNSKSELIECHGTNSSFAKQSTCHMVYAYSTSYGKYGTPRRLLALSVSLSLFQLPALLMAIGYQREVHCNAFVGHTCICNVQHWHYCMVLLVSLLHPMRMICCMLACISVMRSGEPILPGRMVVA